MEASTSADVNSLAEEIETQMGFETPADNITELPTLPHFSDLPDHVQELKIQKRYWWKQCRNGDPNSKKQYNIYKRKLKQEIDQLRLQCEENKDDPASTPHHAFESISAQEPSLDLINERGPGSSASPLPEPPVRSISEILLELQNGTFPESFGPERFRAALDYLNENQANPFALLRMLIEFEDVLEYISPGSATRFKGISSHDKTLEKAAKSWNDFGISQLIME